MATTKITENTQITINPKTKGKTYEFKSAAELNITTSVLNGYEDMYYNFATKKNNDLIITTLFTKENGSTKKVTTTVKNYFKDIDADYSVAYKSCVENIGVQNLTITPATDEMTNGLYSENGQSESWHYILGTTKEDTHTMGGTLGKLYYDTKGNDDYVNENMTAIGYTYDLAGSDTYEMSSGGSLYTHDWAGNDIYSASTENTRLYSVDYAGKDEYTVSNGAAFQIFDIKGNDTYTVEENGDASDVFLNQINDYKGNDTYQLAAANAYAYDFVGKDTYNIASASDNIMVIDHAGNDKFNILTATSEKHYSVGDKGLYLQDEAGSDTYNIAGMVYEEAASENVYDIYDKAGNDKYNFQKYTDKSSGVTFNLHAQNISVYDGAGKDKYTFTLADNTDGIDGVFINDEAGADIYKVSGYGTNAVTNLTVYDNDSKSKDKYDFSLLTDFEVTDLGGNDTYKLTNCDGTITDSGDGNDSYTIDMFGSSLVEITDAGGKKDKLTIANTTQDNIVFMSNTQSTGGYEDNSLIIYNIDKDSVIQVNDFFVSTTDGLLSDFGDGRIETIKIGRTTAKNINKEAGYTFFNQINQTVASWIDKSDYGSVYGIMTDTSDSANAAKEAMIAYYTESNPL